MTGTVAIVPPSRSTTSVCRDEPPSTRAVSVALVAGQAVAHDRRGAARRRVASSRRSGAAGPKTFAYVCPRWTAARRPSSDSSAA